MAFMKIPYGLHKVTNLDLEHTCLLSFIISFHMEGKPFFMLNKPLSNIIGISEKKIREKLKNLQKEGWIDIQFNVRNEYGQFYDRVIYFKKDINELMKQIAIVEKNIYKIGSVVLEEPTCEIDSPTHNIYTDNLDKTTDNVSLTLPKTLDYTTDNDKHIILLDYDIRLKRKDYNSIVKIDNNKLNVLNISEVKECIELLKQKQLDLFGEYKEEMIDLYEYDFFKKLVLNNFDKKYEVEDMFKSDEFKQIEKAMRKYKTLIGRPETINEKTLRNYFIKIGKIQVSEFIYLYPYEILKLRMRYNGAFLSKKINEIDVWFHQPKNYKGKIDHFMTIKDWCERDIAKVENNPTYSNNEIYNYYNWGVSRNG